ncbi:MAG: hypothetical protein ABI114_09055 [Rhodanobacter sp.]
MTNTADDQTDKLVKNERRGVWLALIVVLALAATLVLGSDTRRALLLALGIGIVFAVTWLGQQRTRGAKNVIREKREVVLHDELRQVAIARAYQWAFFTMLGALITFCLLSTVVVVSLSALMVAALTVALGVSVFLGAFLLFDRD